MHIVVLEPLAIEKEILFDLMKPLEAQGHTITIYSDIEKEEEALKSRVKDADILIIANSPLSGEVIRSATHLKMISVAFTGIDHIDQGACKEKGIMICNAAGYSTHSVAELTFGLLFGLLRNIPACDQVTREERTKAGLVGNELYGKTFGIIGTGAIGSRVGELAKAFGCRVIAYSRTEKKEVHDLGIQYVSLDELLQKSDIISLHTPLTTETQGLINEEKLELVKPTAVLINVARGAVVDSQALAKALQEGRLAGAGIDVFEMEPPIPKDHPLLSVPNTIVTPHVAFATAESMKGRAEIVIENIIQWEKGTPQNRML
ncbi:MAG: hydroxyacid dehydrogenase [Epulopiscium sp.]|nr:hydroxyacid dehydrogenase [Candidatus Epulonipiscium sp.]